MNLPPEPFFGAAVRAGSFAPLRPKSFGEVESQNSSGLPANDFPADSFFDVFVEVDLPDFGLFPGGTVYNKKALVVNTTVGDLPPQLVYYIHGSTRSVAVYFKANGPGWIAGDLLGFLSLAGHWVGPSNQDCICEWGEPYRLDCPCKLCGAFCTVPEMTIPVRGACCLHDGTCEVLYEEECTDRLGIFRGEGTSCVAGTCLGACCNRATNACTQLTDAACKELGKGYRYGGEGTPCGPNDTCIPTVSEWGLLVMGILVLSAATVVIMRRRAIVRGGS